MLLISSFTYLKNKMKNVYYGMKFLPHDYKFFISYGKYSRKKSQCYSHLSRSFLFTIDISFQKRNKSLYCIKNILLFICKTNSPYLELLSTALKSKWSLNWTLLFLLSTECNPVVPPVSFNPWFLPFVFSNFLEIVSLFPAPLSFAHCLGQSHFSFVRYLVS